MHIEKITEAVAGDAETIVCSITVDRLGYLLDVHVIRSNGYPELEQSRWRACCGRRRLTAAAGASCRAPLP